MVPVVVDRKQVTVGRALYMLWLFISGWLCTLRLFPLKLNRNSMNALTFYTYLILPIIPVWGSIIISYMDNIASSSSFR